MSRAIYRSMLWLHPAAFRDRFAAEMLWLYDETVATEGAAALLADGFASLVRQWLTRRLTWKLAAAVIGGMLQVGLVLALSRDVHSGRARASAAALFTAQPATSIDPRALPAARIAMENAVPDSQAKAKAASPRAVPVSTIPVGDAPLGFAVLFGIVFVYACQRRRFQLGVRSNSPAARHLSRNEAGEMHTAKPKSRLSIIAD